MVQIRKRGLAAAVICSDSFLTLAQNQSRVFGVPDLPLVMIPHPLGGLSLGDVQKRADIAIPQVLSVIQEQGK
jgi:hypothetical protein